ncbi:MAG TPA: gliding motility-associated C-terminal domain-containing protein [Bacteroidia bacterium]|jgi:gliding motility-associated-like protein
MKQLAACCFFLFLMTSSVSAQITYNVVKQDVKCNNSEYGNIEINVTSTNSPYTYAWNTGQTSASILDLPAGTYSVLITDAGGDDTTVTIVINSLVCEMGPAIVFTPNGDGINDEWSISNSQYFPEALILLYNRLGQKVFEHKGLYEPWNGNDLLGLAVPDASYFYVIYQDKSDEGTIIKGSVTVIK